MRAGRTFLTLAVLAAVTLAAACGRKAPLDSPYEAAIEARRQAQEDGKPLPPEPQKPEEDKPFILDGLIK